MLLLSTLLFLFPLLQQITRAFVVTWTTPAKAVMKTPSSVMSSSKRSSITSPSTTANSSRRIYLSPSSDTVITSNHNDNDKEAMALLQKYRDYSIHDSFNLVVMGDLHLEDDMSLHYQARDDCLSALSELSLLPSPPPPSSPPRPRRQSTTPGTTNGLTDDYDKEDDPPIRLRDLLGPLKKVPAGELNLAQLEILLQEKKHQERDNSSHFINCHLVSLGDLGRKDVRHEPGDAGTTQSFLDAKEYLDGYHLPYDLVTGNHDLEGLDEFETDLDNLEAWMKCFGKTVPYFSKQIGSRTLLVGLSTVRFRDAPHSSHECHVDTKQLEWFEEVVRNHSHEDGWKIFVFTHAPIMGSNLRVLQNVHLVNGCAWMNHCCAMTRSRFIETVKNSPQIKLWCSGHFHLSHDFPDSLSRVNQCTFVQVGVVGRKSTRDHTRQTRIIQGNDRMIYIYTVNHHYNTEQVQERLRLDAKIDLERGEMWTNNNDNNINMNMNISLQQSKKEDIETPAADPWFGAYIPQEQDGCYLESPTGKIASGKDMDEKVCWWHMHDGKVLGVHDGQIIEYDATTLSPLGVVVNRKELNDREVLIVDDSKVVILVDPETDEMEVVHPNDDGSYWRKYQRNKRVRQEEKAREMAAKMWLERKRGDTVLQP